MIKLVVARAGSVTGRLLRDLLRERNVPLAREGQQIDAGVSYGVHVEDPRVPWLNAHACAGNKFTQFRKMGEAGVRVPQFGRAVEEIHGIMVFPLLGRAVHHRGGTDIKLYMQRRDLQTKGPSEFYVEFVPSDTEYRHWIYRGRHLGTYEKVLRHPEQQRGHFGRNYNNGYAFELVHADRLPALRPSIEQASNAVAALDLDFGAVDVLAGEDGQPYVLEVNTSPGVEDERRQVIQALADKIERWVALGYPRRRGQDAN